MPGVVKNFRITRQVIFDPVANHAPEHARLLFALPVHQQFSEKFMTVKMELPQPRHIGNPLATPIDAVAKDMFTVQHANTMPCALITVSLEWPFGQPPAQHVVQRICLALD